jgi:hypothetical protein
MALSAIDSRVSASWLSSGPMLMPMLQARSRPRTSTLSISWSSRAMSLPAMSATERRSAMPSRSTMNSSPPQRDTVSSARTAASRRRATACSTRSPQWWPRLSLMRLKRSRSMNSTATTLPERALRAIARCRRSSSRLRLGRPVRVVGGLVDQASGGGDALGDVVEGQHGAALVAVDGGEGDGEHVAGAVAGPGQRAGELELAAAGDAALDERLELPASAVKRTSRGARAARRALRGRPRAAPRPPG